ncbi:hypothetical protein [Burkholderia pseudomallei]|uniref:hypothetical protein n=1 Tax=Burkholderia pseudomallei TaxID=28450 RepID=UPI0011786009|nr:hypothetical protein [Burkholderia pseudomallei]MBO2985743.1 hypothetical protein [Burkholderia pseudomallei]MBO7915617.1 hypothetical protein [Burkholderia pseudomallei]MBO7933941.1 hypothetical protein [Burkholderia pseudomallei]
MTKIDVVFGIVGAISSLAAAGLWLWSSLIQVPDNIDTFIGELQRISRVNAWAAMCACVAAICAAYGFARSLGWT